MTTTIEQCLIKGKVERVKTLLALEFERVNRQEFEDGVRAEYNSLFPIHREATKEEYELEFTKKEDMLYDEFYPYFENGDRQFPEFKIAIDYSEDESYVTFEEYLNETRVITEAVEATYDEDGMELTPAIAEVTESVRVYIPLSDEDINTKVSEYLKSRYSELRRSAYPPMEMFADAWVKNDEAGLEEYRQLCLAVKAMYPKE